MSDAVRLTIPGRVVAGNRQLRFALVGGHVRAYRTAEYRDYAEQVAWLARAAMAGREPLDGLLAVTLTLIAPHRGSLPDADAVPKAGLDALQGVVFGNDRQVDDLHVLRRIVPGEVHRLDVEVRRMGPGRLGMGVRP